MRLGIFIAGEPRVGGHGHHSIRVRNGHFVAAYQIEGGKGREYFDDSIFAHALLEKAGEKIAQEIFSALVEQYTERLKQKYKR